jgi:DNA-binding MarR family transcriptional regulator
MSNTLEECAREVLEVAPSIMRNIREEMRRHRVEGLSVPQFRTLLFIQRHPGTPLSDVADHLGLRLPSTSKLIDLLVGRNMISRLSSSGDRRKIELSLTERGESILEAARAGTLNYMAEQLSTLTDHEMENVIAAMQALRPIFTSVEKADLQLTR